MGKYIDRNDTTFQKQIIWPADIIMLNACGVTMYYVFAIGIDYIFALLAINSIAIIAFRQWICYSLQIKWLLSPVNRFLKRLSDIVLAAFFLLTIFPIMIILHAVVTKKNHGKSVFCLRKFTIGQDQSFTAIAFSANLFRDNTKWNSTPLVFNILIGTISVWDLGIVQEVPTDNHDHLPTEHKEPCLETFPIQESQEIQEKLTIKDEHI